MRQYLEIKAQHSDAILFFRLGDFYEMFFEDAVFAAQTLGLTLTSRDKDHSDAVPMCGVPHHSARSYIAKLTELGHKVALCEQTEDPKKARGLVKREVVRTITPGIVLDDEVLDPSAGRYLAAIAAGQDGPAGLAYLDVSTGEFRATEVGDRVALWAELGRVQPREIVAAPELAAELQRAFPGAALTARGSAAPAEAERALELALGDSIAGLGLVTRPLALRAAADAVGYAAATQPAGKLPLSRLQIYDPSDTVVLDEAAVANLELVSTLVGGKKAGSLLSVIDRTLTPPGGRMLRRWLLYPLAEVAPIRRRQDAVEYVGLHGALRRALRDELRHVGDLERLAGRVSLRVATPRDLAGLRDSLARLPELARLLAGGEVAPLDVPELLHLDPDAVAELAELAGELGAALVDEPPTASAEGGIIRQGYCDELDRQRTLASGGRDAILAIEAKERERSGVAALKVKYNRVFGYYIEVGRAHLGRVPSDYVRKQTIASGERYVTEELAELETKVLAAQQAVIEREQELFAALIERVAAKMARLIAVGENVASLDCLAALADLALESGYVRPTLDDSEVIDIVAGRHPVVETVLLPGCFVPNDCRLDRGGQHILVVTGPNMAGKSTYMRQVAHIVLLAQMGSFVPAEAARIGVIDRILTRVGATDNLSRGESTFMVEMRETATILAKATRRSLVILDEVGRGTSTYDGLSIAWAVTEYLHDAIGARALFATHYHELAALAETRPRIANVSMAVREHGSEIVFLRQVVAGSAPRSYGIDVARLAGLPRSVIARARQILESLETPPLAKGQQMNLFGRPWARAASSRASSQGDGEPGAASDTVLARVRELEPQDLTPLEALTLLFELKKTLDE